MWLLFAQGDIPLPQQNRSTIMTNELSLDTLDQVSGGYRITTAQQEAQLLRLEAAEHKITRQEAARMLQTWELFHTAKELDPRAPFSPF
jgi:hypothetical protein